MDLYPVQLHPAADVNISIKYQLREAKALSCQFCHELDALSVFKQSLLRGNKPQSEEMEEVLKYLNAHRNPGWQHPATRDYLKDRTDRNSTEPLVTFAKSMGWQSYKNREPNSGLLSCTQLWRKYRQQITPVQRISRLPEHWYLPKTLLRFSTGNQKYFCQNQQTTMIIDIRG